jgi:hypothetical protein
VQKPAPLLYHRQDTNPGGTRYDLEKTSANEQMTLLKRFKKVHLISQVLSPHYENFNHVRFCRHAEVAGSCLTAVGSRKVPDTHNRRSPLQCGTSANLYSGRPSSRSVRPIQESLPMHLLFWAFFVNTQSRILIAGDQELPTFTPQHRTYPSTCPSLVP